MKSKHVVRLCVLAVCLLPPALQAKVSQAKANQLGGQKYTCMGALRAGSDDGVAKYTGKWLRDDFPGANKGQGYPGNPYKNEKPLFTITAANMAKYSAHLTAGQKALFKKNPHEFKMNIYKSHRDFRFPDYVCKTIKKNATTSVLTDNGLGVTGTTGAPPFPFPKNGIQAIWNVINPVRSWTSEVTFDTADVFRDGSKSWGRTHFMTLNMGNNPNKRGTYTRHVNAFFYHGSLKPAKDNGKIAVGYQPNNFAKDQTQSWQYQPGIRRVRKAPEIGFDYPVPPNGLRTVSEDYVFNGSPAHYNWKLEGKKEIYVPYNNFRMNKPGISYKDLLGNHVINPKYVRYELHRVWVIVGTRKKGIRDIYNKRVLYVDPDSWLALTGDNYDNHNQLYRVDWVAYFYSQISGTYIRGASIYQDLHKGAYEATYLTNEEKDHWWKINIPLYKRQFSPQAAARAGH